jgi:phospholipid transport system substrate-binding protein
MTVSRLSPMFLVVIGALLALAVPVAAQTTPTPAKPPTTKPAAAKPAAAKPAAAKPAAEAAPAGSDSPLADLKKANQQLKKSFGNRKPSWSPEAEAKNTEIRKIVGSFLDFEELSRRSLAKHWEGLTAKQRADFVKTLRELVERNYIKQLYGQPDYDLRLEREEKTDNDAAVFGTLHATAKGKKVTMALEYKLVRKGNRWVVYDVITDDLSLLENYRAEFNKVIAKESFDALLARMKKKLAEK